MSEQRDCIFYLYKNTKLKYYKLPAGKGGCGEYIAKANKVYHRVMDKKTIPLCKNKCECYISRDEYNSKREEALQTLINNFLSQLNSGKMMWIIERNNAFGLAKGTEVEVIRILPTKEEETVLTIPVVEATVDDTMYYLNIINFFSEIETYQWGV